MKREISTGSQLYINGNETPDEIRELVRKMNKAGLRLIRLFMLWDLLEKKENEWDFTLFDAVFDEAERCNMGVIPTLMPVSPPGYMKITRASQDIADIDDIGFREKGLYYVRTVVAHYKDFPALHSWILWNEPSRKITLHDTNIADFTAFMQRKYGDINSYNSRHYRKYESYEELKNCYLNVCPSLAFAPYTEAVDLLDYSVENLCTMLRNIGEAVRKEDKNHPIHINPHDIARASYGDGQSFHKEGKTVDFIGCSAHPSWHSTDFPKERIPLSIGYFAAVMRAASPDKDRFWVTELQGGTNIFSGNTYLCPDKKDIGLWLAEGFSEGAESSVFWCFNTRNSGFEGGEWGLLNQLGEPSERLDAVASFSEMIRDNQALFNAVRPAEAHVYILYSDNSIRLQSVETVRNSPDGIRNKNNGIFAVIGAYTATADLGYSPAIIYEEDFAENGLPADATLILTDTYCLNEGTIRAIKEFAQAGGTVLADGLIAMKTADGRTDETSLSTAAEIFGAQVEDIIASADAIPVTDGINSCSGEFLNIKLRTTTAEKAGNITINRIGKGRAYRIPAVLFRRYRRTEEMETLALLKGLLPVREGVALRNPAQGIQLKVLEAENGRLLVYVLNPTSQPFTAEIAGLADVREITPRHEAENNNAEYGESILAVKLGERDFAIFEATRR